MKKSKIVISILLIIAILIFFIVPTIVNCFIHYHGVVNVLGVLNIQLGGYIGLAIYIIRRIIRYGVLLLFIVLNLFLKDKAKMIFNAIIGILMILMVGFNFIAIIISYLGVYHFSLIYVFELNDIINILITVSIIVYIFNSIPNGSVLFFINTIFNIAVSIAKILFTIIIAVDGGGMLINLILRGTYYTFYTLLFIIIDALFIMYFWKNE